MILAGKDTTNLRWLLNARLRGDVAFGKAQCGAGKRVAASSVLERLDVAVGWSL